MILKMKTILYTFLALSLVTTQAWALSCGLNCSVEEGFQTQSAQMANHDCCPETEQKPEKDSECKGDMGPACLHEVTSLDYSLDINAHITQKVVFGLELPIISLIKQATFNNRDLPKVFDLEYLKFKSSLDLYLLKDQFLI